jgi:sulfofructose kinase
MNTPRFDILGLGCVSVDDLLYVDQYPAADCKTPILHRQRQGGGLTGTALVAAARWGATCQYAGCLGRDELSQFIRGRLSEERIGTEHILEDAGVHPVHSIVIVDEQSHTRTIFFDVHGAAGAGDDWPLEPLIRSARVLFVDVFGLPGMIRAAKIALAAGIPVVADFEQNLADPKFTELIELVNHPILPLEFARRLSGCRQPDDAVRALWSPRRQAIVVTCGAEGCWYVGLEHPSAPQHQPAFPVEVVDTTGCGDVFHGVYAATLAQGVDLPSRIKWAAAAAALKATARGGQTGIPRRAAVEEFTNGFARESK